MDAGAPCSSSVTQTDLKKKRSREWTADDELCQKFSRYATAEQKAEYKSKKGNQAKKAYRQEWEITELKNVSGRQEEKTSDRKEQVEEGWYSCFAVLVQELGGLVDLPGAIRRATCLADSLEKRGPPWVVYNPDIQEVEFVKVKKRRRDTFARSKDRTIGGQNAGVFRFCVHTRTRFFIYSKVSRPVNGGPPTFTSTRSRNEPH